MPKVGSRRQITLTVEQCNLAGIAPGDECETFVSEVGQITIIKKPKGKTQEAHKAAEPNNTGKN